MILNSFSLLALLEKNITTGIMVRPAIFGQVSEFKRGCDDRDVKMTFLDSSA